MSMIDAQDAYVDLSVGLHTVPVYFEGLAIRTYRRRVNFSHQATLNTHLAAKVAVREQSDAQFLRDFFESEYHRDPQPRLI